MSCEHPLKNFSLLLDGELSPLEQSKTLMHMENCRSCNAEYQSARKIREQLRAMSRPAVPAALTAKLRVIASHEIQRRARSVSIGARFEHLLGNVRLMFDNMMRPVALPFAGGLLSALLMFGSVMPRLEFQSQFHNDVPTNMLTDPDGQISDFTQDSSTWGRDLNRHYLSLNELPRLAPVDAVVSSDETSVVLTIDPNGKVVAWDGGHLTPELESIILFSRFTPATLFGQPTWGKKQLVFRRSSPTTRS
jgi:hypothetical protein